MCSLRTRRLRSFTAEFAEDFRRDRGEMLERWYTAKRLLMTNTARLAHLTLALLIVILDRWTKRLAATRIAMYAHIQVIPGFFRLTHTENTGAAFSLFADSPAHWKTAMLIGFS